MSDQIQDDTVLNNTNDPKCFFLGVTDSLGGEWLNNVAVGCISSQRATNTNGTWKIDPNKDPENTSFFTNGANIKSIKLPDTLFAIADRSFYNCTNISEVTFEEGCMIVVLGESAFEGCTGMQTFRMASTSAVETIGQSAFKDCSNLQTFYFPSFIKEIGNEAFSGCTRLGSISYDEDNCNITSIGNDVFKNCSSLKEVVFPVKLEKTGDALFEPGESQHSFFFAMQRRSWALQ